MSDSLVSRLVKTGKTRIAVANFTDLQGNVTELGKYIAEAFNIELSNSSLSVVDRSRIKDLLTELKLTEEKLTRPENALKLGEMAGIEFIITGTTVILDTKVDITVKALDIQNGTSIAGQRGAVPRTEDINNLARSTVSGSGVTAANVNLARVIDTRNQNASDDVYDITISDMRKSECETPNESVRNRTDHFGQACFENLSDQDLVMTVQEIGSDGSWIRDKVFLPKGGRGCCPRILLNRYADDQTVKDVSFSFVTTGGTPVKKGSFVVTIEKCKVKSVVLTRKNLYLEPQR